MRKNVQALFAGSGIISRSFLISLFLTVFALVAISVSPPGWAEETSKVDRVQSFNIPRLRADKALVRFARQADVTLLYPYRDVKALRMGPLRGQYTVAQGLELLLADTGMGISAGLASSNQEIEEMKTLKKAAFPAVISLAVLGGSNVISQDDLTEASPSARGEIEEIVVSVGRRGSGERSKLETTSPVDVLGSGALENTGLSELNQVLANKVPSFNFPQTLAAGATEHVRPANLRGLSPDHTLVLINGKRRHVSSSLHVNSSVGRGSNGVNLNRIPAAAIERIEVLRDGAAAQYGSDAIAGVLNIVLKDQQEGGFVKLQGGAYSTSYAGVNSLSGVTEGADGKLQFNEGGAKDGDAQTYTLSANFGLAVGQNGFLNLSAEYRDRDATDWAGYDPRELFPRQGDGTLDPRELTIDRNQANIGLAAAEELNLTYNYATTLAEGLELYSFGSYGTTEGESFNLYRGTAAKDGRNPGGFSVNESSPGAKDGPFPFGFTPGLESDITDYGITLGVSSEQGSLFWDLSLQYGQNELALRNTNTLNTSLARFDGLNGAATTQTDFDLGTNTYGQFLLNADASYNFTDNTLIAFGAEYRRENFQIEAGEEASYRLFADADGNLLGPGGSQGFSGFSDRDALDESRRSYSLYAEIDSDLTERLNVQLAGRFEDYSDFGSDVNFKIAGRYEFADHFAVRGSYGSGFRAPSLVQSFYSTTLSIVPENAQAGDEPVATKTIPVTSAEGVALGLDNLQAETSEGYTIGLVYSPLDNWDITLDYYRIDIEDRITLSANLKASTATNLQTLLAAADIVGVSQVRFFSNAVDTNTRGVDLVTTYRHDFDESNLNLSLGYNHNLNEITEFKTPPASLGLQEGSNLVLNRDIALIERGTPRHKVNLSARWNRGPLNLTYRINRFGTVFDDVFGTGELDAITIQDIDVKYEVSRNLSVSGGVNNMFDERHQTRRQLQATSSSAFVDLIPYSGITPAGREGRFIYGAVTYAF